MNNKGQSALEYLMTYGWALIVIAIVIGILIYIMAGATGEITCTSQSAAVHVSAVEVGGDNVLNVFLMNSSGGTMADVSNEVVGFPEGAELGEGPEGNWLANQEQRYEIVGISEGSQVNNGRIVIDYKTPRETVAQAVVVCNGPLN